MQESESVNQSWVIAGQPTPLSFIHPESIRTVSLASGRSALSICLRFSPTFAYVRASSLELSAVVKTENRGVFRRLQFSFTSAKRDSVRVWLAVCPFVRSLSEPPVAFGQFAVLLEIHYRVWALLIRLGILGSVCACDLSRTVPHS